MTPPGHPATEPETATADPAPATKTRRSGPTPLGENVILIDWERSEQLQGFSENACRGTIYATGAKVPHHHRRDDGTRVLWVKHSGHAVELAGVRYLVLDYRAILAAFDGDPDEADRTRS